MDTKRSTSETPASDTQRIRSWRDLRDTFPLLTTKKLHLRSIIHELIEKAAKSTVPASAP